ncbi:MAG: NAD(P)-binding protein [Blastocatellia bacterium]|nr:NAD(P)-binding protein [Blastocatellia bacterium]
MANDQKRKKIAVLGGGIGALSTAFCLTEAPGWREQYEIHVYQQGWRLGGKGASGRNADHNQRIEEHGLHVWGGYYENAFAVMRKCYEEMGRPQGAPLATIDDAFKKQSFITVEEYLDEQWQHWYVEMPTNKDVPGVGGVLPTPWAYLQMAVNLMVQLFEGSSYGSPGCLGLPKLVFQGLRSLLHSFGKSPAAGGAAIHGALRFSHSLHADVSQHDSAAHRTLLGMLEGFMDWLWNLIKEEVVEHAETRRMWIGMSIAYAHIRGMIADGVLTRGFGAVEDIEWSEWMRKHGAAEMAIESPMARCLYNTIFGFHKGRTRGFVEGDMSCRAMSAQSIVHGLFRFVFTYKGAIFWEMQAGMGDTVFTPLYQVLKKRGVHFHFFHRIENLGLSKDGQSIATIRLGRQVTLNVSEYDPLRRVNDLDCWPSEPRYEQIVEGEALRRDRINLESAWTPWKNVEEKTLEFDRDFHQVVLGISLAALKDVCPELVAARPDWKNMVEKIETVQTQAVQLWLKPDAAGLGWEKPPVMLTSYAEPLDTWADLSHLLPREAWPAENAPRNIAYFCGPMEDPPIIPPFSDHGFPERELNRTKQIAADYFSRNIGHLWPRATTPGTQGLNWDLLAGRDGDGVYYRANANPTDRYVINAPGTARYRMAADASGFDNLYLAGDWVYNSLNYGCIEAAVMTGMHASRAICGFPQTIIGDYETAPTPGPGNEKPPYVVRGGEQVYAPPIMVENCRYYAYLLEANAESLQALCDRELNTPSQGNLRYVPLLPRVILGFADLAKGYCLGQDRHIGWMPEIDVAFWVPLARVRRVAGIDFIERIVWYMPYVFVDTPLAVAAGREIWGFHKQMASFQVPKSPSDRAQLIVEGLAVPHYNPDLEVKKHRILEVLRLDAPTVGEVEKAWAEAEEGFRDFLKIFLGGDGTIRLPGLGLLAEAVDFMAHHDVPLVFLKQFRDVHDGARACYQAIVEANAQMTKFHSGGWLPGEYQLNITPLESHPIARDLGLSGNQIRPLAALYVNYDFRMNEGKEVWRAG